MNVGVVGLCNILSYTELILPYNTIGLNQARQIQGGGLQRASQDSTKGGGGLQYFVLLFKR